MIVTDSTVTGVAAHRAEKAVRWGCLARRGMLHSECETVDYLELAPQALVTMGGRAGTEEAWYVLDGHVTLDGEAHAPRPAGPGALVLRPASTPSELRNPSVDTPARLLLIAVLPPAVTDHLPRRRPTLEGAGGAQGGDPA